MLLSSLALALMVHFKFEAFQFFKDNYYYLERESLFVKMLGLLTRIFPYYFVVEFSRIMWEIVWVGSDPVHRENL